MTNVTQCEMSGGRRKATVTNLTWSRSPPALVESFLVNGKALVSVGPLAGRIRVYKLEGSNYKLIMDYRMKNFCQHFFWGILHTVVKQIDDKCNLAKGTSVDLDLSNYEMILHKLFGGQFFYGKYRGRCEVFTNRYTVMCLEAEGDCVRHV